MLDAHVLVLPLRCFMLMPSLFNTAFSRLMLVNVTCGPVPQRMIGPPTRNAGAVTLSLSKPCSKQPSFRTS